MDCLSNRDNGLWTCKCICILCSNLDPSLIVYAFHRCTRHCQKSCAAAYREYCIPTCSCDRIVRRIYKLSHKLCCWTSCSIWDDDGTFCDNVPCTISYCSASIGLIVYRNTLLVVNCPCLSCSECHQLGCCCARVLISYYGKPVRIDPSAYFILAFNSYP